MPNMAKGYLVHVEQDLQIKILIFSILTPKFKTIGSEVALLQALGLTRPGTIA
jgi:hypothetical protein